MFLIRGKALIQPLESLLACQRDFL
ncbi:MAG: hypothetical protein RL275_2125, partial [Chloroflexota bacterium]